MDVIFENQFVCSKDYYKEYYKYSYLKKPIIIILNIILMICFATNVLLMIFPQLSNTDIYTAQLYIANVLVILCAEIYIYIKNVNLTYNRDLERNKGNPIQIKLLVIEDNIKILSDLEKELNIELKSIEKVIKTKNYYILVTKAKLGISFKKDSFVKGTVEEFEKFLKQKKII